jgi:iron complex outermembrane receptor protein
MFISTLRHFSFIRSPLSSGDAPGAKEGRSAGTPVSTPTLAVSPGRPNRLTDSRPASRWTPRLLALLIPAIFALPAKAAGTGVNEIIDTPFEQLLQTEVITAEKLAKQISGAPSAVSIVTAQDIKDFGYRTLSDILDSMRGLSMSHDHEYGFLAGRGYANPGDYAGRITMLIDGYRASDNILGQSYFGNDGLLDVELIERVEYIPGSGSSSYGDSAFLGVINIVTKKGNDINATQVSGDLGSHGLYRERIAFGQKFENGLDLLFSASALNARGRYLPAEFGKDSTTRFEKEDNGRLFLKASYGGWSFQSAWVSRTQAGTPRDETTSPTAYLVDENSYTNLKYDTELAADLKSSTLFYTGQYRYQEYKFDGWRKRELIGQWRGIDSKLVSTHLDKQTLVLGAEYRDDNRQSKWEQPAPLSWVNYSFAQRQTWSLYAYDDLQLSNNWQINFGGRVDARNNGSKTFSPRAAVIYVPTDGTTLKLSSGEASRQQVAMDEWFRKNLAVEHLRTNELVWEQALGPKTRLTSALYSYRISNFAVAEEWDPAAFKSTMTYGSLSAKGAELELEHLWDNGLRLRASYAWQDAKKSNNTPILNLAHDIAKLNLSAPVAGDWLRAGLAVRYLGKHYNWLNEYDPATLLGDLTLTAKWNHWSTSFSIRNLANAHYREVGRYSYGDSDGESYGADRRNFWFQLGYEFK